MSGEETVLLNVKAKYNENEVDLILKESYLVFSSNSEEIQIHFSQENCTLI